MSLNKEPRKSTCARRARQVDYEVESFMTQRFRDFRTTSEDNENAVKQSSASERYNLEIISVEIEK